MHTLCTLCARNAVITLLLKMGNDLKNLKNDLKVSFSKAKEHIISLESQIIELKYQILEIKSLLNDLKPTKTPHSLFPSEVSSKGNEGVHSFIHSVIHSNIHTSNTQDLLKTMTKQEVLVLLTIAQLEEELHNITYPDIANKLKLSQGCIRSYITSLIRKNAPIYKEKYNNKITIIKTNPHFKSINKQVLIDAFYKVDTHQKRLFE